MLRYFTFLLIGMGLTIGAGWTVQAIGSADLLQEYKPQKTDIDVTDVAVEVVALGTGSRDVRVPQPLVESGVISDYLKCFGLSSADLNTNGDDYLFGVVSALVAQSETVDKVVMLARDGVVSNGVLSENNDYYYVSNEFVYRQTVRYENLLFGASINPYRKNWEELLLYYHDLGAVLVRWVPATMKINPADSSLVPFYKKLVELNMPLLVTIGDGDFIEQSNSRFGDPTYLTTALEEGVKVIIHQLGTNSSDLPRTLGSLVRLMNAYPNLYADVGRVSTFDKRGILSSMAERVSSSQLVYSMGAPVSCFPSVSPFFEVRTLGVAKSAMLLGVPNPWDRDVVQKRLLGVPEESFYLGSKLFPKD